MNRRQLLVGAAALTCTGCSATAVVAEQPIATDDVGFGSDLNLGTVDQVLATIRENDGFWYVPEGRAWLTEYPAGALDQARRHYSATELVTMEAGFVALFQKCTHLGCRVPSCTTSQLFECPCHGSKYNQVGEQRGGPAPRGLDRFAVEITAENQVVVKTAELIPGPPPGTDTTGQIAAGPLCVGEVDQG